MTETTSCVGSNIAIGTAGTDYPPAETFPCPACGQETNTHTDGAVLRLNSHLRAAA